MKFEEFLTQAKALDIAVTTYLAHKDRGYSYRKEKKEPDGFFLTESWTTGGVTGGSCWDTGEHDNHCSVEGDREPDFEDFDRILEHFCPGISFLTYKRLTRELVHYSDYTQNEYYGNYYNKMEKWVDLKELFNALRQEKNTTLWEGE